jgi:phospholipid/cholesterol/gamma-HCH transport system permease protein
MAVSFSHPSNDTIVVRIAGEWKLGAESPQWGDIEREFQPGLKSIIFETGELKGWDSSLLSFLIRIMDLCSGRNIEMLKDGLPEGMQRLLNLASPEHQRKGVRQPVMHKSFFVHAAEAMFDFIRSSKEILAFIGEAFLAFMKFLSGKANFRRSDFFTIVQDTGARSLPIVSLISLLVGLILAFVGAIQLKMFGAQIYVADVVGIGMVRVMGAIMTGIIMAGKTGASFAAQLGTMQVNEEIDALKTLGIPPMEFLVLPRMLALVIMMPLLCLYADLMGILGGFIVGVGILNLGVTEYYHQTASSVTMTYLWIGLFHSLVFGVLVALSGCLRGMQCGRSASEVGYATTSAVVTSIVSIIVATAIITFGCEVLGI